MVTEELIRSELKNKIKKYEKLHYRDINLSLIPNNLNLDDISKIFNLMIR